MKITKRKLILGGVVLGLSVLAAVAVAKLMPGHDAQRAASAELLNIDLAAPDVLIQTQSLTEIPRDVLSVPLFKDLLTEDFVFYYEQNEGRLGLQGTLRRIAYEHELSIGDEIIAHVLDKPAEMALWKSHEGRLGHYLIAVERDNLTSLLETVSKIALDDSQLTSSGEIELGNGDTVSVYRLEYTYDRSLYFAGYEDRLVVFSDLGMVASEAANEQHLDNLFRPGRGVRLYGDRFHTAETSAKHSVMVSTKYLSFGYQAFFPAFEAVRFDYSPEGWNTAVLADGAIRAKQKSLFSTAALWKAAPTAPSLCVAVPADAQRLRPLLEKIEAPKPEAAEAIFGALDSPVAACWYPKSKLHAPLIFVKLKESDAVRNYLKALFENAVGSYEAPAGDSDKTRFDVSESKRKSAIVWQRIVGSDYGLNDAESAPHPLSSSRYFNVTLAYAGGYALFSPDETLVDDALAVLEKRYAALGDSLGRDQEASVVVYPASVSELVRDSVLESLPGDDEPVFRESASTRLLPALENVAKHPAYALSMPQPSGSGLAWEALKWESLSR